MAYRIDENNNDLIIDGFQDGIASSPYTGIANISNLNTSYYPSVAYVNYRRQAATLTYTDTFWYAGTHSTNVSNNHGWTFSAPVGSAVMTNPVQKAISTAGLYYILDDTGQIWKQTALNSTTFNILGGGSGRFALGNKGLAYWNNYLVVFGAGVIEFCGDGTGDSTITSANWNLIGSGSSNNIAVFTTAFGSSTSQILFTISQFPHFAVNDAVQFTTTGTLPTGLSLNTVYYIKTIDTTAYSYITVSTTIGGSATTFSDDGSGVHTVTDYSTPLPLGNATALSGTFSGAVVGNTTLTIVSYTDATGTSRGANWYGATGLYNIVMTDNQTIPANFTNGSATVTLLSPLLYTTSGTWSVQLIDTTVSNYRPYVSKVDGSLLFANGQFLGRISQNSSPNLIFNPGLASSYTVSSGVTALPEQKKDTIVDMTDLKSNLIIAGQKDVYVWDYLSAATSSPTVVGEKIKRIINLLNNIYILAGQKGNIYVSNGYSAQLFYKIPDFIAGIIDPVWSWGDMMVHRSKLFFQLLAQNTSGTNLLAGIFSIIASPSMLGETGSGFVMESQNSYGLTPSAGALSNGILIDNSPSANGNDSYYSAWSDGASLGGIDYNDTTLWQNWEPTIETDIIPIGTILDKKTFGNIEFKLDRPMASGDQIRMYFRPSLTDSYTLMGTTTSAQLSDYYPSNISQSQWAQFKIQFKCASTGSSFIPLREIRLHAK